MHVATPVDAGGFCGREERRASCFQTGREGRRCCWWEGRGGQGMIVTRLGWPTREAAVDERQKDTMSNRANKRKRCFANCVHGKTAARTARKPF